MRKFLLISSLCGLTLLQAETIGVRDILIKQGYKPISKSETVTEYSFKVDNVSTVIVKDTAEMCKELGGDNLYALIPNQKNVAYFDDNGKVTSEGECGFFKFMSGSCEFDAAKKYDWECKKGDKTLFKVKRKSNYYVDSLRIKHYSFLYTVEHGAEKLTAIDTASVDSVSTGEKQGELVTQFLDTNGLKALHVERVTYADPADIKTDIAKKTVKFKSTFTKNVGNTAYIGTYNGQNGSCELVSVISKVEGFKDSRTYNYKICQNKVISLGETSPTTVNSKNLDAAIKSTAKFCQQSGSAMGEVDDLTISCKALRDKDTCSVEVSVLNNTNQLIDKKIINACN